MVVKYTSSPSLDDVISVADLKTFLRVSGSTEDSLIGSFRDAAIQYIESACNIRIGDVTAVGYLDSFTPARFPVGPIASLTNVKYYDQSNTLQTLETSKYYFETVSGGGRINWHDYPSLYSYALNRVEITFQVGYAEADVPEGIKQAIRILVGHYYENRQAVVVGKTANAVPLAVDSLLNKYRVLS